MAGEELLNQPIFRKTTMDSIISEIGVEDEMSKTKIRDAFFPFEQTDDDDVLALIEDNYFGKAQASAAGSDYVYHVPLPGHLYKEFTFGRWEEAISFHAHVLSKVKNPRMPGALWGEEIVTKGLGQLKERFLNLQEWMSAEVIFNGQFTIDQNGVYYQFQDKIPPNLRVRLDGGNTPPWTSAGSDWTDTANTDPVADIRGMINYLAKRWGLIVDQVWMNTAVAELIMAATKTKDFIKASPRLSEEMIKTGSLQNNLRQLIDGTGGVELMIWDRHWSDRMTIRAEAAAGGTTITVDDASRAAVGEYFELRNATDESESRFVGSKNGNVITLGGSESLTNSYKVDDPVYIHKPLLPDNKVAFRTTRAQRVQKWASIPIALTSEEIGAGRRTAGPRTYRVVKNSGTPRWFIEVGSVVEGGVIVMSKGGYATLQIKA